MHFGGSVIPYDFEPIRCENYCIVKPHKSNRIEMCLRVTFMCTGNLRQSVRVGVSTDI